LKSRCPMSVRTSKIVSGSRRRTECGTNRFTDASIFRVKRAISDSRSRALVQPKVTTFLESVKAHGDTRLADHDQFVSLRVFADRCTRLLKAIENAASTPDEVFQFVSAPSPHASSS
jgi:hypothetical protein